MSGTHVLVVLVWVLGTPPVEPPQLPARQALLGSKCCVAATPPYQALME